jgi:hypothetical protein
MKTHRNDLYANFFLINRCIKQSKNCIRLFITLSISESIRDVNRNSTQKAKKEKKRKEKPTSAREKLASAKEMIEFQ